MDVGLGYKESWAPKNWCFWAVVLEETLQSSLDCKEIKPVNPKGNQPWIFIVRTDAEALLLFRKLRSWHPVPSFHGKQVGKKWKQWETLFFLGAKITTDGDCSREIKRHLLLLRKVMTNLDSILKSRDITLPTEVHLVKAMVFPVVMYGYESWLDHKEL